MALTAQNWIPILLRKTSSEREEIRAQAMRVAGGFTTSISALSMTNAFDLEAAGAVLQALDHIDANPELCVNALPKAPTLGHTFRFQRVSVPQGFTHSC